MTSNDDLEGTIPFGVVDPDAQAALRGVFCGVLLCIHYIIRGHFREGYIRDPIFQVVP